MSLNAITATKKWQFCCKVALSTDFCKISHADKMQALTWYAPTWEYHSALQTSTSTFAPRPHPDGSRSASCETEPGVVMCVSEGLCMGVAVPILVWSYACSKHTSKLNITRLA